MTVEGIYTPECQVLPDGRVRHFFAKVDGEFICTNCGETSQEGKRWGKPRKKAV